MAPDEAQKKLKLGGLNEVATALGKSKQRVTQIRQSDPDFPEPLDRISAGSVWDMADVVAYKERRGW
jgi:hypothetical protein